MQETDLERQFATRLVKPASGDGGDRRHARRPAARALALSPVDAGRPHIRAGQAVRRTAWLSGIGDSRARFQRPQLRHRWHPTVNASAPYLLMPAATWKVESEYLDRDRDGLQA
jgi:hypothetical protein